MIFYMSNCAFNGPSTPRLDGALLFPPPFPPSQLFIHPGDPPVSRRSLLEGVSTTLAASVAALAVQPSPAEAKIERIKGGGPMVTLEDGAQYQEMTLGDGATPKDGDRVAVHYSLFYNGGRAIIRVVLLANKRRGSFARRLR